MVFFASAAALLALAQIPTVLGHAKITSPAIRSVRQFRVSVLPSHPLLSPALLSRPPADSRRSTLSARYVSSLARVCVLTARLGSYRYPPRRCRDLARVCQRCRCIRRPVPYQGRQTRLAIRQVYRGYHHVRPASELRLHILVVHRLIR